MGFSWEFPKDQLGTNPPAIAAPVNYLTQMLNHVNRYTGLALKDEPYVCDIELINEPTHHAKDFEGSVKYINALVDAVRNTGCQKITFYNVSQDFAIGKAIAASKADGSSFAWHPSGLVSGRQLFGNFLRTVDEYSPMLAPELAGKPKIAYEFDMPDVMSGYHYPAMARTFRSVGAQFAAMFSYDMLATGPIFARGNATLPQAFPGSWSYWTNPPTGKTAIDLRQIERLQFSLRKQGRGDQNTADPGVAIESVSLQF